ncbi:hypothetical protein NV379_04325 [Paenibacillus sp. N1-5-1-14]|uniref:hypothetical protein n=1 Tax=Paenibacillus radicibacter TaxID=2972488 RepID=UPI0021593B46|nr:hypothetical protein [Paenibacillus radicibacter]MCR8641878.1 hypothetical protein [Paenibacillus radicibacter]
MRYIQSPWFRKLGSIVLLSMLCTTFLPVVVAANDSDTANLTVQSSPTATYRTTQEIHIRHLQKDLELAAQKPIPFPAPYADMYLSFTNNLIQPSYAVTQQGEVMDLDKGTMLQLDHTIMSKLRTEAAALHAKHYGKLLKWEEIHVLLPKYAKFTIKDLETGQEFQGQRRAGSSHADVQPLTKADSAIMKKIYGGKWSWLRRAVLIKHEGSLYAGSMHGMPHGGDGIPDNDFKGHFCIHFAGSVTHGNLTLDTAHQAMTYMAAGQLPDYLATLTPVQLMELWTIAINRQDAAIYAAVTGQPSAKVTTIPFASAIRTSKPTKKKVDAIQSIAEPFQTTISSQIRYSLTNAKNGNKKYGSLEFLMVHPSLPGHWVIQDIHVPSKKK